MNYQHFMVINNRILYLQPRKIRHIMYSCKPIQKKKKKSHFNSIHIIFVHNKTVCCISSSTGCSCRRCSRVEKVKDGMALFKANCAACHAIDRKVVGPALSGVWDRWESEDKLVEWVDFTIPLS